MTTGVMEALPAPIALEDGLRKWRIQRTIDDPFEFGRIYFPKYWFQASPAFHEEIIDLATHRNKADWVGKENLNTLVLAAPRNHSKCIKYDTKILLSNGSSISIQDIQVGEKIISLNESTLKFEHDEIVAKTESGVKNLIKIKTKTGKIISMTVDHKVLTFDGWKLAGDLTLLDKIASPRSVPNLLAMQFKTRLETLEKADVFWDSIVEISEDKSALTFDVETKINHNLVTNGLVTHNSTLITFLYVIWSLVTQRKFFTVIISDIARISVSHSRNIKEEFESNERLKNDWGIVLGKDWDILDGASRGEKEKWTDEEFVIGFRKWDQKEKRWSGTLEDRAKVLARMANNPLRGLRFGHRRPDLVIADDLENDELVDTSIQRQKLASWWDSAVEPMIEPPPVGQIILVGTVLHYGSLLNQMLQRDDLYVTRRYQAIVTEKGEDGVAVQVPLWPERFSLERLIALKSKNVLAFQKEYMNEPRDDTNRTFRGSWIQWYDANDLSYKQNTRKWYFRNKPMTFFTGVDWSVGKDDSGDFFSLVMIGKTVDNDVIVFDIVNERTDVANQINRVILQNQSYFIQMNGIEGNGFQHVLIQQVLRRSMIPIKEIKHVARKKKQIRIEGMATIFEQGKIYLRKCLEREIYRDSLTGDPNGNEGFFHDETRMVVVHPEFWKFYEQLMTYPRSEHDDMLDSLEMALETSRMNKKLFDEVVLV